MRVLVLKPHPLSLGGHVGDAMVERGAELVDHVLSEDHTQRSLDGFDAMIVMGAPWSVYGDEVAPWIEDALEAIRDAVARDVPILGICFGAQAFAQAMGGRARQADDHEVGWRTVQTTDPKTVPEGPWFMWHGDTFDLPPGATAVASTPVGVQAFTMGPHICVQFHPEATPEMIENWLAHSDEDFRRAGIDQADVLEETRKREPEAKVRAAALVDRFLNGSGG
ncbi:MAG: type 1 glutamine amidotransferase [Actinomycetota bacterium]